MRVCVLAADIEIMQFQLALAVYVVVARLLFVISVLLFLICSVFSDIRQVRCPTIMPPCCPYVVIIAANV